MRQTDNRRFYESLYKNMYDVKPWNMNISFLLTSNGSFGINVCHYYLNSTRIEKKTIV